MVGKGTAATLAAVGVGAGLTAGYFVFGNMALQNVFTDMGISNNRTTLIAELTAYGYTTAMLTALADASIWDLQCIVGAHLIAEQYGLSSV